MIFPGGTSRAVVKLLQSYFATLKREGTTESMLGSMLGFDDPNRVIGTPELMERAAKYE